MQRHTKIFRPPKKLMKDHIPNLLTKTMETYVLPTIITNYATINLTFDLWIKLYIYIYIYIYI